MLPIIKFVIVIFVGYMMKRLKLVKVSDIPVLSAIMMYITLPCTMAASTETLKPDRSLFLLAVVGFVVGAFMMCVGRWITRDREEQILFMVNLSSLNIGSFAIPFLQGMFPPAAIAFSGVYDMGNTWYGNGVSYLIPKSLRDGENGFHFGSLLKRLCRSVPLMTYIVFLLLAFFGVHLPSTFFQLVREVGNCNFLIVFLIAGIAMDLHVDKAGLKTVIKFLLIKYGFATLISLGVYYLLPFDLLVRQAAIVCIFCPQSSTSVPYCEMLGCDPKVYSTMYTCSIFACLCSYFVLSLLWAL